MSTGLYSHTTRGTGTVLTAAIYNADHTNHITNQNPSMTGGYSDNVAQMQTNTDPGGIGTESLAASLAGELERLRFQIKGITGQAQWYAPAPFSLANLTTSINTQKLTASKDINFTGDLLPPQITANQNDYAPTGHATAFRFLLTSDASRNITGLAGGAAGRLVVLTNSGSFDIVLTDQDTLSSAANRFLLGSPITIRSLRSIVLQYDAFGSRWRPVNTAHLDSAIYAGTLNVIGLLTGINQKLTGFLDLAEIASPANPAADVLRLFAKDVSGVTTAFVRDSAGVETAISASGFDLLGTVSPSSQNNVDFSSLSLGIYSHVILKWDGASTDNTSTPTFSVSDDNGSTFQNIRGVSRRGASTDTVNRSAAHTDATAQTLGTNSDYTAGATDLFGTIQILFPGVASTKKSIFVTHSGDISGAWRDGGGQFITASMGAINMIRFSAGGGINWDAGTFKLYGVR